MNPTVVETPAANDAGLRVDVFLSARLRELSRAAVKKLCGDGLVRVGGRAVKASYKVVPGEAVEAELPPAQPIAALGEAIPLNIVYEDEALLVVNKPRGLVVHPAAGNPTGTLVNALLGAVEDLSALNGPLKPGIVHRIDKDTTGLLMVAKTDEAHRALARQIQEKTAGRVYIALVHGNLRQDGGRIDAPVGRDPRQRQRMAVVQGGRNAATNYTVLERFGEYTLVQCRLETGRTHQIRVHMKHLGHPVVGDEVYGYKRQRFALQGQLLHAARLELTHPLSGERLCLEAPLPQDFAHVLKILQASPRRKDEPGYGSL